MTIDDFEASAKTGHMPAALTPALTALWHDAAGDWPAAHGVAQDIDDETGAWIHAYLHRKEGDQGNAGYWYRRCRIAPFTGSLEQEWQELVSQFLNEAS
jgi:hypothetical protein